MNRWRLAGLRIHWFIGLIAGLFLTIIGFTGAVMAFEDEIIDWLNPSLHVVQARSITNALPYSQLLPLLQNQLEGQQINLLQTSQASTLVVGTAFKGQTERLLVDATNAKVIGKVRGADFFAFIRQIHRWLALPGRGNGIGRTVTGLCAASLVFLAISGILLGWKHRHNKYANESMNWKDRRRYSGWHVRYGLWIAPFLLWSALTGMWWSFDGYRSAVTFLLGSREAKPATKITIENPISTEQLGASLDTVLSGFKSDARRVLLTLPRRADQPIRLRWLPVDAVHDRAYDEYQIAPDDGRILGQWKYEDARLADRFNQLIEPLHTGTRLGWLMRIALFISSLSLPVFALTGLVMYLLRRKRRY